MHKTVEGFQGSRSSVELSEVIQKYIKAIRRNRLVSSFSGNQSTIDTISFENFLKNKHREAAFEVVISGENTDCRGTMM